MSTFFTYLRQTVCLFLFCCLGLANVCYAQEENILEQANITAVINGPQNAEIGKNIIFDASKSIYTQSGSSVRFKWDLGDGTRMEGEEIVHVYKQPKQYIIKLSIEQDGKIHTTETAIFTYNRLVMLVSNVASSTDLESSTEDISGVIKRAEANGTLVKYIPFSAESNLSSEAIFTKRMVENRDSIEKADTIIFWPDKTVDFNLIIAFNRDTKELGLDIDYAKKTFFFISDQRLGSVSPFAQSSFNLIKPEKIFITHKQSIPIILDSNQETYLDNIRAGLSEIIEIDAESGKWRVWNMFSTLSQYLIERGVPTILVILILMLPIMATIIAFFRQVIGLTTFGIYTPTVITISFIALTFQFGLAILLLTLISGTATRILLDRFRLLYIPKVAIIFTSSSFVIFLTLGLSAYLNFVEITSIAIFPMLIMLTMGEKFLNLQAGQGLFSALLATIETVFVSTLCYFVATAEYMQTFVLNYPGWMFLLIIVINVALGRFTGLRLNEYFRFRSIFQAIEE